MAALAGLALIVIVLLDTFETILLPRRINRRFRLVRAFFLTTWIPWAAVGRRISRKELRERVLGVYGPFAMVLLVAFWASSLIVGFGLLQWGIGAPLEEGSERPDLFTNLYFSGTTFFTLGLGDVEPVSRLAKAVVVLEAGTGFGFLAIVIGYLPVLYQVFSSRESLVTMLDARAGSPPTTTTLLTRLARHQGLSELPGFLQRCEQWSAELLESHLSYPMLSHYRSHHRNQSWLGAMTTILDTSALVVVGIEQVPSLQAQFTFAMARNALVDLARVLNLKPARHAPERLSQEELNALRANLAGLGVRLASDAEADERLSEMRQSYEPYLVSLGEYLMIPIPAWTALPEQRPSA